MMVPGCIEQHPDFLDKRGIGCYTRKIEVAQDGNLRFEFKGVSHTADVYLDNEKLVHHYNAFTPFSAIAKNVQAGVHELKVYVDNRFTPCMFQMIIIRMAASQDQWQLNSLRMFILKMCSLSQYIRKWVVGKLESELYFQIYRRKNIVCRLERFLLRIVCMRKMELV